MAATHSDDFHPDLQRIARVLPRSAFNRGTVHVLRAATNVLSHRRRPDVELLTTPTGRRVRLHRHSSTSELSGALLWIHGGGYAIGTAAQDDRLCRRFSTALRVPVAAVEYRLAPRHPYPAALLDCYDALSWLSNLPGVDSRRVVIAGASAGGGLTAALALLARDRSEIAPLFQLLVYPMVDDRGTRKRGIGNANYRMWNEKCDQLGWGFYLRGADPHIAVPARHEDLAGVAPAWIGVGSSPGTWCTTSSCNSSR